MTDIADLRLRVSSDDVPTATRRLNDMTAAGGKAERATDGLMGTIGKFATAAAATTAVLAGLNKMLDVQRQFDVINAGLVTATGSSERAAIAFGAIQDFATKTPYDLAQVSDAFTKLVNYGLDPSEKALTSYGNMASAMGKDLSQMIEAVADASTGEFERLKEFGIVARKQGDDVRVTFQGVTETIRNDSQSIQGYLRKLSDENFASAMTERMSTLDGAMSNLGDEWDKLFLNLSKGGFGDAIAEGVNVGIDALSSLNEWLTSGEFEGAIDAMAAKWAPWAEDASQAVQVVKQGVSDFLNWLNATYPEDMKILSSAWGDFPENVRAIVQIAATHVAWFVEEVRLSMDAAKGYIDAIRDGWGGSQLADVFAAAEAASARNKQNLRESIDLTFRQMQATKDSAKSAQASAIERAAAAKQARDAERDAHPEGVLGQFGRGPKGPRPATGGKAKGADSDARRRQSEFDSLVADLRTEEEALQASYEKRRSILERQTGIEASLRGDLMRRLEEWRANEAEQIDEQKRREFDSIQQSLLTEEEAILASYDKRRKIVMDAQGVSDEVRARTLERLDRERDEDLAREQADRQSKRDRLMEQFLSEEDLARQSRDRQLDEQKAGYDQGLIDWEEYQKNKAEIERRYHSLTQNMIRDRQVQQLDAYGSMFGALGQMFGQFAQGQGKAAERMFKISKALNMAQAIMGMAAGIMEAQKLTYPMNIVESVRIGALGAMQIASISSQRFSGAYDKGGKIPAGKFGVVGERGMEFVEGPANVTGRQDTARLLRQAAEGGGGDVTTNNVAIHVHLAENGATSVTTESRSDGDAEQAKKLGHLIDLRVRDVLLREQRQGGILSPNR